MGPRRPNAAIIAAMHRPPRLRPVLRLLRAAVPATTTASAFATTAGRWSGPSVQPPRLGSVRLLVIKAVCATTATSAGAASTRGGRRRNHRLRLTDPSRPLGLSAITGLSSHTSTCQSHATAAIALFPPNEPGPAVDPQTELLTLDNQLTVTPRTDVRA